MQKALLLIALLGCAKIGRFTCLGVATARKENRYGCSDSMALTARMAARA